MIEEWEYYLHPGKIKAVIKRNNIEESCILQAYQSREETQIIKNKIKFTAMDINK